MYVAFLTGMGKPNTITSDGSTDIFSSRQRNPMLVQERCSHCNLRQPGFFCDLPQPEFQRFAARKITRVFSKGTTIFVEGQPSTSVFMLCHGRVKLSTCSSEGKVVILGVAERGEVLGLSAALTASEYEMTAEAVEPCQVNYLNSSDLLQLLKECPEACLKAARQLSRNYRTAHNQICSLGLSDTVADKLAKLFLDWSGNGHGGSGIVRIPNFYTHEEMAEMIGVSRETVTRALRFFREKELVTVKGAQVLIHDRDRLKAMIGTRPLMRS